ncbi:hypothetical protein AQ490_02985 [Wenjunlia vitaminophila]|uniref:Zf-HC2 domain-containing protein n=1 Tax=Wenjunlia vitaminophila TaxID=76728 RepID=A0A0T6LYG4_WENVI|nr:hypothetical protein AQ490_02985 [Wenjunlia vitaminophila]
MDGPSGVRRWHLPEDDVRDYACGSLTGPRLWSAETHLASCDHCRARLTDAVGPAVLDDGWARLDAELDVPRPGPLEWVLLRLGVADHTARLLAATSTLRRAWLGAVVFTLLVTVAAAHLARGGDTSLLFLAVAPLLPLSGVALSFGPGNDPTYEMAVVAPVHSFRLLMIRTVSVLASTNALSALASLAVPSFGPAALGWLLPSLALTSTGLLLMSRLGPVWAPVLVGSLWGLAVLTGQALSSGTPLPFTAAGQLCAAAATIAASAALVAVRDRFDRGGQPASSFPFRADTVIRRFS